MNEITYIVFLVLIAISNLYAFKIGGNRKRKEVESLRKHLNESMKLVFVKQREINSLKTTNNNKNIHKHHDA